MCFKFVKISCQNLQIIGYVINENLEKFDFMKLSINNTTLFYVLMLLQIIILILNQEKLVFVYVNQVNSEKQFGYIINEKNNRQKLKIYLKTNTFKLSTCASFTSAISFLRTVEHRKKVPFMLLSLLISPKNLNICNKYLER